MVTASSPLASGATGVATTNITVRNVNQPPVANAGPTQTVDENVTVTLSGSGTDPDGTVVAYQWTQTGGRAVTLDSWRAEAPVGATRTL